MKKITIGSDLALLITRLIIGGIFVFAGWTKVADMQMTLAMFGSMNIPVILTYVVSYGELVGGVLLMLGLCTSSVAFFLSVIMIVAIYLTRGAGMQMYGMPLVVLASLISIWGNGAGKYSIKCPRQNIS